MADVLNSRYPLRVNDPARFSVILAQRNAHDPVALAKALAAAHQTPLQDQMVFAKSCWGVLSESLGQNEAQNLKLTLGQCGVQTIVCPSTSLISLPAAEAATAIQLLSAAKPVLIAAAAITITSTTTKKIKEGPSAADKIVSAGIMLTTGLPIRIGGKERTVEKTQHQSDLVFYLDVIYRSPLRRLRVDAQNFDYSFLKERKLYQVMGNFKLLVGDLVKGTPEAWQNHGTRVLLESKPIQTMGYGTLADLERETRWLLTLQQLNNR
jgi:hypothetical protein